MKKIISSLSLLIILFQTSCDCGCAPPPYGVKDFTFLLLNTQSKPISTLGDTVFFQSNKSSETGLFVTSQATGTQEIIFRSAKIFDITKTATNCSNCNPAVFYLYYKNRNVVPDTLELIVTSNPGPSGDNSVFSSVVWNKRKIEKTFINNGGIEVYQLPINK
jgi:hypothetical protein